MTKPFIASAALLALLVATPSLAQPAPSRAEGAIVVAQAPAIGEETKKSRSRKKEPTARGMAAKERQRKCGAEWKEAKAAGKTEGLKWPKFWSQCNARLKGSSV